ncbi:hypothetical protein C8_32 [Cannes 8 virus]|uniref:hypothetical protein n=1 Tax=Melbournevirus TaxID=1560514 RepID=UPI000392B349|nr:hypothetical protein MEL_029 [Melbournevirus]AGV01381.1 hypothetical protein C8_32 [Cannes 8 virus]AIT54642.1 hypothetical protein MEL_029 [Melbournevirus]AVR52736.1 hypothetical protein MarSH_031 [Marseillevirus Shanghai 1]
MSEQECKDATKYCERRMKGSLHGVTSFGMFGKFDCLSAMKKQQECYSKLLEETKALSVQSKDKK